MKKITAACIAALALALLTGASHDYARTFRGDIADSQCALNVHSLTRSHQEMMKTTAVGGSVTACAQYCIKYLGGDFVLSSQKKVYRLDNQGEAAKFAGQKVKLTGTLNPKGDTLHVVKIETDEVKTSAKPLNEEMKPSVQEAPEKIQPVSEKHN
jgi:hypothetical protein